MNQPLPTPNYLLELGRPLGPEPHPLGELIADALDEMEPEDRRAIEAIFYERVTYADLASELGLAGRQGAHWRVAQAMTRLKVILIEKGLNYD
jgi:DNA-directed RNA polymerase specialized sigma24 family protein